MICALILIVFLFGVYLGTYVHRGRLSWTVNFPNQQVICQDNGIEVYRFDIEDEVL